MAELSRLSEDVTTYDRIVRRAEDAALMGKLAEKEKDRTREPRF